MVSEQATPRAHPYPGLVPHKQLAVPTGMAREEFRAMGTTVSLLLPSAFLKVGAAATRQLFTQWEQTLSRFLPESELSRLNQQSGTPVKVSDLLFRVTQAALTAAQETEGLFDPTLLTQLMQVGYDRTFDEVPAVAPAAKHPSRPGGDWHEVRLNHWKRAITLPKGVGLEFGGIAKGMAVDAALTQLRLLGVQAALVNAGGDLAAMGLPGDYESWPLAIAGKDISWSIPFQYGALATSGVAKRHWQQGNLTRHHLIDPRSGESAQNSLWSVTVAADNCEHAEVAAKAVFLLGPKRGKDFLQDHGLSGLLVHTDEHWTSAGAWPVALMQTLEDEQ